MSRSWVREAEVLLCFPSRSYGGQDGETYMTLGLRSNTMWALAQSSSLDTPPRLRPWKQKSGCKGRPLCCQCLRN